MSIVAAGVAEAGIFRKDAPRPPEIFRVFRHRQRIQIRPEEDRFAGPSRIQHRDPAGLAPVDDGKAQPGRFSFHQSRRPMLLPSRLCVPVDGAPPGDQPLLQFFCPFQQRFHLPTSFHTGPPRPRQIR